MKIGFAGLGVMGGPMARHLVDAGHEVRLVVTQPDRPTGRGQKRTPGAVKRLALERRLDLFQPETMKSAESLARLRAARPEEPVRMVRASIEYAA